MKSSPMLIVVFLGVFVDSSRATICKPLSQFRVDCNICYCSENGKEYSCTRLKCAEINPFLVDDGEDGYVLKPKTQPRHVKLENDEIPISAEEWDDDFMEVKERNNDDYDNNENDEKNIPEFLIEDDKDDNKKIFENFEDVSLEVQDAGLINEDLPDYFRLKRSNLRI